MKRVLSILLVTILVLLPLSAIADSWTCPNSSCGRKGNTNNFCPQCGTARPTGSASKSQGSTSKLRVGSYVTLGQYPQTANGGYKPIQWLVLTVSGTKALLLSRYALECLPFNAGHLDEYDNPLPTTWRDCSLRSWLSNRFFTIAFKTGKERSAILETSLKTYDINTGRSYTTKDKVFLLSSEEVRQYISDDLYHCEAARAYPSDYAVERYPGIYYDDYSPKGVALACDWWLRSQDFSGGIADQIDPSGSLDMCDVSSEIFIRPAVWVDMNAGVF